MRPFQPQEWRQQGRGAVEFFDQSYLPEKSTLVQMHVPSRISLRTGALCPYQGEGSGLYQLMHAADVSFREDAGARRGTVICPRSPSRRGHSPQESRSLRLSVLLPLGWFGTSFSSCVSVVR